MAGKQIVFLCLVIATLGSAIFDNCDIVEPQNFDIRACTVTTETVAKVHGRCPTDVIRLGRPVCKDSETEYCLTRRGITTCNTFPDQTCVKSYTVDTRMLRNDDEGDTCETDKGTCADATVEGALKQTCS